MSGHFFPTCVANLKSALKKYHPSGYVIIETSRLLFSDKNLIEVYEERFPKIPANDNKGIFSILREWSRKLFDMNCQPM